MLPAADDATLYDDTIFTPPITPDGDMREQRARRAIC